jgi:hypothetical protein
VGLQERFDELPQLVFLEQVEGLQERLDAPSQLVILPARSVHNDLAPAGIYLVSRYNLACDLALMIPVAEPDRREALAAGYSDPTGFQLDHDLDALRARPDFRALLKTP